jgi:rhomboid protease GluP
VENEDQVQGQSFGEALAAATPVVYVTPTVIAINVIVFVVMVVSGVPVFEPTGDHLIRWGADFGPLTTHGEWWRIVTAAFVHVGLVHLLMNMAILLNIGLFTERLFGNGGFTVLYLLSGLGGSLASLAWRPFTVSAGASGAIFGLYGGLLGFLVLHRQVIPNEVLRPLMKSALIFLGYNLIYGLAKSEVDMAAHLGGLATGFCVGCALAPALAAESGGDSTGKRNLAVALAGALILAVCARSTPVADDLAGELNKFGETETRLLGLYNTSIREWQASKLNSEQFASVLEKRVLPEWNAERDALGKLSRLPDRQRQVAAVLGQYMSARADSWALMMRGARANDEALVRQANERQATAEKFAAQIEAMGK